MTILDHLKTIVFAGYSICRLTLNNFSLSKAFSISNFLKLLFIYVSAVILVIYIEFDFSKNFFHKFLNHSFSNHRIAIYSVKDRIGEGALYLRFKDYAEKEGYDYVGARYQEGLQKFAITAHLYRVAASVLQYILNPQFSFSVTHHVKIIPFYGYNIVYLNMPMDNLYEPDGSFQARWQHLHEFDAYADIHSLVHGNNQILEKIVNGKKIIPLYIAYHATEYKEVVPDKALVTGSLWGCNRNSFRIKMALKKLAEDNLLVAIGLKHYFFYLEDSYLGSFENLGKMPEIIEEKQREYGIALLFHTEEHVLEGIPTSRILEAIASSALVISDQHYFLRKFFGDNVLYFNSFATQDEIYSQVQKHVKWARQNQEAVRLKTKKAHDIFMEHFTIKKQMEILWSSLASS